MEIIETIDKTIKEIWLSAIKVDYQNDYLLLEDALKCALYHHLRNSLGDEWLIRNRIRIYPEYHLYGKRRADIAIIKLKHKADRLDKHLSQCTYEIIAIIEIKYKNRYTFNPFYQDKWKLYEYSKHYHECQLYAAFIQEKFYNETNSSWFDARQTKRWAKGRLSELLGYWDEDTGEFVTKIHSY